MIGGLDSTFPGSEQVPFACRLLFAQEKLQELKRTADRKPVSMLRVTEIFRSIQGESTHAGRPCAFVRLTGCPMRCVWCDSEYTFTGGEHFTVDDVINQVRAFNCKLVEVTGGEPLAQREAFTLVKRLCDEGFEVLVETGGFVSTEELDHRARIILDVKCPASGEAERNHWPNLERLRADKDEVKFVIMDLDDWKYAGNYRTI